MGDIIMSCPIVEVNQLSFRYDQRFDQHIIKNISFSVTKGERIAIIGNNGSGKSTLAQLLVGLLTPQSGKIKIAGIELNENTKWEVRKHINLVFQNPDNQFIGTTVQDDIAFGLENLNMPYKEMKTKVDQVLKLVGMTAFRNHDPSRLSGGQKQRVAIASVLAMEPDIIVLDVALVMLDPRSRRELLQTLQNIQQTKDITIISITHDMEEAVDADRIILMEHGQVKKIGSPVEIFTKENNLQPPFIERLRRTLNQRSEEHTSELQSRGHLVCRLLLEKK